MVSKRRKWKPTERELNVIKCPVCNAVRGEPCFTVAGGKFIMLKTTHITQEKAKVAGESGRAKIPAQAPAGTWDPRRRVWVPTTLSPDYRPMALDRTYD